MVPKQGRQTGARIYEPVPEETDRDREHIDEAKNEPPADGQGLSRDVDETNTRTRQSDGTRQLPGGRPGSSSAKGGA